MGSADEVCVIVDNYPYPGGLMAVLHSQIAVLNELLVWLPRIRSGLVGLVAGMLAILPCGGGLTPFPTFSVDRSAWAEEATAERKLDSQQEPAVSQAARERITAAVNREIEAKLFPGVVLLVGNETGVLYHEAFGSAQVEPDVVPMQRDSLFDIASVTTHVVNPQFPKRAFVWEVDPASRHRPRSMSDRAYGHSGNTGISLWIDPAPTSRCYAIVMTNRNHPRLPQTASGKEPTNSKRGIEQYRARGRIADAALLSLELTAE